ncbi:hypothetical protein MIR68_011189 [Amoeboaphelidium protococcarum]|nr:hypothetical protein MIR68_011189 [Amoeboaphelidium protococcarum]
MVLFKRQVENYVRYHPIDRINSENFGEFLVLMHCFLKEIEVLQENDKAQYKMMSLVPIMKCDCQHLMLSETSFQNSNVEVLQDRDWASQCFNIEGFEDIFTNTLYLDMYSVSFVNASRPGGQKANVQFINNDDFQRQAVAYMLEDQFDDQIQAEEDADGWQDEIDEILDLIDDQEDVDQQEAPLQRQQQQTQLHLNDPDMAEGLPDRHEMVRFIGVDVGIRRAVAACTMEDALEEYEHLRSNNLLNSRLIANLGQRDPQVEAIQLVTEHQGLSHKTVNPWKLKSYMINYLTNRSQWISRMLSSRKKERNYDAWFRSVARLENAVQQLLDQPILNPDDASKYLVFFGAAGSTDSLSLEE